MPIRFWIMPLVLLLSGCGQPSDGKQVAPDGTPIDWPQLALPGKTLVLIHPTQVRDFQFRADFTVGATFGNDGPNGPIAGPILFWGIDGKSLVISRVPLAGPWEEHVALAEAGTEAIEILSEPTVDHELLHATRQSGERATFRLLNAEQP